MCRASRDGGSGPSESPQGSCWAPELAEEGIRRGEETASQALATLVLDPDDPEYGGFRSSELLVCEGHTIPGTCRLLTVLWNTPGSRYFQRPALVESIRRALAFLEERAQYQDGSLSLLSSGDMKAACMAGFASLGLRDLLRLWERIEHPAAGEIIGRCRRCMIRAGNALRTGGLFTQNHRWVANAAMAEINSISPDERLVAKIDDYFSDGIDQDEDGFYSEYSIGYGILCDECFARCADLLGRPFLLDHVRRNLGLIPWLRHPNGEVACEFTYRSDIGGAGSPGFWLDMAERFQDGRYVTMARDIVDLLLRRNALDGLSMLELAQRPIPAVEAVPLPDTYRRSFARGQIARIRRGPLSVTVMGRAVHPTVPYLGKPENPNFLAIRYGDAIIDGTCVRYKYYGERLMGVRAGGLTAEGDEFVVRHDFTDFVDGPIPARHVQFSPDLHLRVGIREVPGGIALSLRAEGLPGVSVLLEFAVRSEGHLVLDGKTVPLQPGAQHYLPGGTARIVNGPDELELSGDLVMQHRLIAGGTFTHQRRVTSLLVAPRTPHHGTITLRGRRA